MIKLVKGESLNNQFPFSYVIYNDNKVMEIFYNVLDNRVYFYFETYEFIDEYTMYNIFNRFNNLIIKNEKPISMLIRKKMLNGYNKVFNDLMYYEKGSFLQRKVESYRYLINDYAFDDDGYIVNQGLLEKIKFGIFKTSTKGCGWIAIYNLFKLMHKEKTLKEINEDMSKKAILLGLIGQDVLTIYSYLRKKGVNSYFTPIFKKQCIREIKKSSFGIILYIHKRGSHYVAYKNIGDGNCLFFNAIYGVKNHVLNIEEFYKQYSITPFSMLISVE